MADSLSRAIAASSMLNPRAQLALSYSVLVADLNSNRSSDQWAAPAPSPAA